MSRQLRCLFPSVFSPLFEEEEHKWLPVEGTEGSGLTLSEDEKNVYIEASVPGLKPEELEMTFEKGVLWIRGAAKEEREEREKKFYYRANRTYSYRVAVPGPIDESRTPEAIYKNGVLKVTFAKTQKGEPKKITIRHES